MVFKIKSMTTKNPYGYFYTASNFVNTLNRIWLARTGNEPKQLSLGVISDGSMGTAKGKKHFCNYLYLSSKWCFYVATLHILQFFMH